MSTTLAYGLGFVASFAFSARGKVNSVRAHVYESGTRNDECVILAHIVDECSVVAFGNIKGRAAQDALVGGVSRRRGRGGK